MLTLAKKMTTMFGDTLENKEEISICRLHVSFSKHNN